MPPITSVKDNKVNSAAGIALEPIEYRINPKQTIVRAMKIMCCYNLLKRKPDF